MVSTPIHQQPCPDGFTYLPSILSPDAPLLPQLSPSTTSSIPWEARTPLSRRKIIHCSPTLYVALNQWDSGFQLPNLDIHGGVEMVYVLEGCFVDQNRQSGKGTFIRGEPGSSHQPTCGPEGVTFLAIRELKEGEAEKILGGSTYKSKL